MQTTKQDPKSRHTLRLIKLSPQLDNLSKEQRPIERQTLNGGERQDNKGHQVVTVGPKEEDSDWDVSQPRTPTCITVGLVNCGADTESC